MSDLRRCDKCNHEFSLFDRWGTYYLKSVMTNETLCKTCGSQVMQWIKRDDLVITESTKGNLIKCVKHQRVLDKDGRCDWCQAE